MKFVGHPGKALFYCAWFLYRFRNVFRNYLAQNKAQSLKLKAKFFRWMSFRNIEAETTWPPFADIFHAFSWMKTFVFWLKFHWSLFLWMKFTVSQHWFQATVWCQATIWTNDGLIYWCIYESLGLNELKIWLMLYKVYPCYKLTQGNKLWLLLQDAQLLQLWLSARKT